MLGAFGSTVGGPGGVREVSGGVAWGGAGGGWGSGRWADGGPGDVERAGWCRLGWGAREESSAGLVRVGGVQRGSKEGTGGPGGAKGVRGGSGGVSGGGLGRRRPHALHPRCRT